MPMALPRVLRNYQMFIDGQGFAGRVDAVTMPALELVTEEHRAGGMDVPVDLDMGMNPIRFQLTMAEHIEAVYRSFGVLSAPPISFSLRSAVQAQGGPVEPVIMTCIGRFRSITPGESTLATKNGHTAEATCNYYRLDINGSNVVEIDVVNMKRLIDGVDQLAEQRGAIGL